jgi:hypothetical protein
MRASGYVSYVCYPIIANNELLGVIELASKKESLLDHTFFGKLEPAFTLLAQGSMAIVTDLMQDFKNYKR